MRQANYSQSIYLKAAQKLVSGEHKLNGIQVVLIESGRYIWLHRWLIAPVHRVLSEPFSLQPLTKQAPQGHIIVRFLLDKRTTHTHTHLIFHNPLTQLMLATLPFVKGAFGPTSALGVVALNGFPCALIGVKSTGRPLDRRGTKGQGLREPEGPLTRGTAVTV